MKWTYDDGGRSAYFKADNVGDCVCRAIAIATEQDYKKVYDDLAALHKKRYGTKTARNGANRDDIRKLMLDYGWEWHPTMRFGKGCEVHMREDELPSGRLVLSLSRHLTAVVDGVCHDTYDPSRDGTRCVYGYWRKNDRKKLDERIKRIREARQTFTDKVGSACDDLKHGLITPTEFAEIVNWEHMTWKAANNER